MQQTKPGSSLGRHRRPQVRSRHAVRWAAGVAAGAMVVAGCGAGLSLGGDAEATCSDGVRTLRVAVTPELARIVTEVARGVDAGRGTCSTTRVTATSSADVAHSLRTTGASPDVRGADVWIPDSSVWLRRSAVSSVSVSGPFRSVARSPIVVAVARQTAARLPGESAALTAALLGHVDGDRSQSLDPFAALAGGGGKVVPAKAVPASEQQVWAHNRSAAARQVVAIYPSLTASSLDYPWVVLARYREAQEHAVELLAALIGQHGRKLLLAAGFRDGNGVGGPALTRRLGVDRTVPAGPAPRGDDVDKGLRTLDVLKQGTRMLAVIDVSGSMGERVPGTGGATRLDLTKQAAVGGLGLYPDDTQIGLWAFSTHLTSDTDYRELVPIGPLGARGSDPLTGRQQLGGALASLQHVPGGGTGLYDTALAATRRVRAQWQPGRVNSVVLLTDGQNDDAHGIGLTRLLTLLRNENDPQRPVPLITIAYGADSPVSALRAMSAATGGATYLAEDPRQVRQVFLQAIQQRACRPTCGQRS